MEAPAAMLSAPVLTSDPDTSSSWRRLSVWGTILVGLALLFVRKTDAFVHPQFWAEDGPVYFMSARLEGASSLLRPYDGIYNLVQRSIAYAGNWIPVRYAPLFYNYCAALINLAALVFILRSEIPVAHRAALAIAALLVPHSAEVWVNLTNVHWMLGLAMLVLAASPDPKSQIGGALQSMALLIMALTGPFAVLFLPIFVVRAFLRKSRWSWLLLAAVAAGALCQLKCQWVTYRPARVGGSFDLFDPAWKSFWGNSLSGLLLLGKDFAAAPPNNLYLVVLSVALYVWLTLYALWTRNRLCGIFLWGSFSILAAVAFTYKGHPSFVSYPLNYRYFYIPFVCTAWALLVVLEQSRTWRTLAGLALVLIAASSLTAFRATPLKDLHWAERSRVLGGPVSSPIPINPEPWRIYYVPHSTEVATTSAPGPVAQANRPPESPSKAKTRN